MKKMEKRNYDIFPVIDAHIHFDQYKNEEQNLILDELEKYKVRSLISVSYNLDSSRKNLELTKKDSRIKAAFGFHPEQPLPVEEELQDLIRFIHTYHTEMVAIGEIGLPYYLKLKDSSIQIEPYIDLLAELLKVAITYEKPVALHAIYEDAPIVIDLLEKYSVKKVHFHWYKGDNKTLQHMAENGYFISFTPDLIYEEEIQTIARNYPLEQVMLETDGPWPFEGPFLGEMTHPKMIHTSAHKLAEIKKRDLKEVYQQILRNTERFYSLK